MLYAIFFVLLTICNARVFELELTDSNFDDLVSSNCENEEWLIAFMADWCQSCSLFKPELHRFSYESPALEKLGDAFNVGVVNIASNPGLASRFMIFHIPSIYHGQNNSWRLLTHHRSYDNLTNYFIQDEWKDVPPRFPWAGPCSMLGKLLALVGKFGGSMVQGYEHLRQNYPPWVLYAIFALLSILPVFLSVLILREGASDTEKEDHHEPRNTQSNLNLEKKERNPRLTD
jgi:thioredoxin 1